MTKENKSEPGGKSEVGDDLYKKVAIEYLGVLDAIKKLEDQKSKTMTVALRLEGELKGISNALKIDGDKLFSEIQAEYYNK